ncbi:MAG: ERCC4 domain-containing protein [Nocardioides sp.]
MPDDFLVARNPEPDSRLPYLLRIPLGDRGVILKSRESWPRKAKVYCHRIDEWPADVEVLERVPTRSCVRRGAAIDLVLDRTRENRSQLVITQIRGGRQAIFWQTARTAKQARPAVRVPRARAAGVPDLEITVDTHERYPYTFSDRQAVVRKASLIAGDYGVVCDDDLIAVVERKSLADLVSTLTTGRLKYQLAELAAIPRAAVVVEERYSAIFKLDWVRPAVIADGVAECAIRWPEVPIMFCETRTLAQEWTFRFLGAAAVGRVEELGGHAAVSELTMGSQLEPTPPTLPEIRAWAREHGYLVSDRGRVAASVVSAYHGAHAPKPSR